MTAEFKSWRSFQVFSYHLQRQFRYIRESEAEEFLETVLATSHDRRETIPRGQLVWRAQLGHDVRPLMESGEAIAEEPTPYAPERMTPPADRAKEGRVNPKGIPCLYVATHRDTAIVEVRPWKGLLVSVGHFQILRELKVINCVSDEIRHPIYFREPSPQQRARAIWSHIDQAFSTPVTPDDTLADYVPTQVLAELFKSKGFDGIAYRSAFGSGHNIALFDLKVAALRHCALFEIADVKLDAREATNPYFIIDKPPKSD